MFYTISRKTALLFLFFLPIPLLKVNALATTTPIPDCKNIWPLSLYYAITVIVVCVRQRERGGHTHSYPPGPTPTYAKAFMCHTEMDWILGDAAELQFANTSEFN